MDRLIRVDRSCEVSNRKTLGVNKSPRKSSQAISTRAICIAICTTRENTWKTSKSGKNYGKESTTIFTLYGYNWLYFTIETPHNCPKMIACSPHPVVDCRLAAALTPQAFRNPPKIHWRTTQRLLVKNYEHLLEFDDSFSDPVIVASTVEWFEKNSKIQSLTLFFIHEKIKPPQGFSDVLLSSVFLVTTGYCCLLSFCFSLAVAAHKDAIRHKDAIHWMDWFISTVDYDFWSFC